MSKRINCVIDTHSASERKELVNYIAERDLSVAVLDDNEGFQLVGVMYEMGTNIGYVGVIVSHDLVEKHGFIHFSSFEAYRRYREAN